MQTDIYTITGTSLGHRFGAQKLFSGINITLKTGSSIAITGPNGSGKSTLMQILAGIRKPTSGTVSITLNGTKIQNSEIPEHAGFSSPIIIPYGDLTGMENVLFVMKQGSDPSLLHDLMESFSLTDHRNKTVKQYSTGMVQRLKLILSMVNNPSLIFFDEPGSNLDAEGKKSLVRYIDLVREDTVIVIATNDPAEAGLCGEVLNLA